MHKKVVTAAEAVAKIPDGAFIALSGVNKSGIAMELLDAVVKRYQAEGHPARVSLIHAGGNRYGTPLARAGMVDSYYAGFPTMDSDLVDGDVIPTYSLTQGICAQLYRAQAADYPYLTKVGLHTYLDPRFEGGAANAKAAKKPIVEVVTIGGEEYLHYKLPPITAALIRATTADPEGNLTNEDESIQHELLYLAMAAHNNGGVVIAQVKNLAKLGSLKAADIRVPGMLVDYVVVCSNPEEWHPQSMNEGFEPALTGRFHIDESQIPIESWAPKGERLIVGRRAISELWPGCICNVGIGTSDSIVYIEEKEGLQDLFSMTVELGAVGGITGGGMKYFSGAFNAQAYLNHLEMFDFYNGHGLDLSCLSAAEIGEDGSVNVTRIAGKTNGSGGFVNIAGSTRKIVFMTTLTVGCKCTGENGKLKILKEGRPLRFVKQVEQVSFNGKEAAREGKDITYVTERAVFKLINGKVTLIEYAPGVDIERDILAHMGFRPDVSPALKPMPAYCFTDEIIGLKAQWEAAINKT